MVRRRRRGRKGGSQGGVVGRMLNIMEVSRSNADVDEKKGRGVCMLFY